MDSEHIIRVFKHEMPQLIAFLQNPNGAINFGTRLTIEAVEDGGILVRTKPFKLDLEHVHK